MAREGTPARTQDTGPDSILGRAAELATVLGLLSDPDQGVRALVVAGEAGVGKTTVWTEGVEAARTAGWTVLTARGSQSEADLSFAGLADLLEPVPEDILATLPEVQRAAVEIALIRRPPTGEPIGEREIGAGTVSVLRRLGERGPVLVAVDDLPWLDDATSATLRFALRRLRDEPIRILATRRIAGGITDDGAADTTAADDVPVPVVETLRLQPLGIAETRQLLADRCGVHLSDQAARRLTEHTGGNPFWILEVGTALARGELVGPEEIDGELPVPARLSALVAGRLAAYEPQVREVLYVVAALDRPTLAAVRRALAPVVADPDAAIDQAVAAGAVIEAGGQSVGRRGTPAILRPSQAVQSVGRLGGPTILRPSHPLLGAAAIRTLPPTARAALHHRLAEAVADPEQRALHVLRAAGGEPDATVAAALDAGSRAADERGVTLAAAELAEQAAAFTPPDQTDEAVGRRQSAADLYLATGRYEKARQCAEMVWKSADDRRRHALPTLTEATYWSRGAADAQQLIAPLVADSRLDPHTRAVVLATAADVGDGLGTPRAVLARQAVELFDQVGPEADRAARSMALLYSAFASLESGEGIAFDTMRRVEELQRGLRHVASAHRARDVLAMWHKDVDDLDRSRIGLHAAIADGLDRGEDGDLTVFYGHLALTEIWAGRYAAAREAVEQASRLSADGETPMALRGSEAMLLLLTGGDIAETRPKVEELLAGIPAFAATRGFAALLAGDDEAAVAEFDQGFALARRAGFRDPGRRGRIEGNYAQALVNLDRLDEAAALAEDQLEIGLRHRRPTVIGVGRRIEGLVLAARGDPAAAVEALEAAVAEHRRSQFPLELGRSLLALGQARRRSRSGAEAGAALREAADVFTTLGAAPFADTARAELAKGRRGAGSVALTATEQQVAELVASGMTNREVAARLFSSVRTVETHIAAVYRKLGIRSRSELAARWRSIDD